MSNEYLSIEHEQRMSDAAAEILDVIAAHDLKRSEAAAVLVMAAMDIYESTGSDPKFQQKLIQLFDGVSLMLKNNEPFFESGELQ